MRLYSLLLLLILTCFFASCNQDQGEPATLAHLPITIREGYGPFHPGYGRLANDNPESPSTGKTYLPIKGVPKYWNSLSKTMVWLDSKQLAYQNALANHITPENYKFLQREWRWTPDTAKLSARPIKCYVYIIKGFDEKRAKWAVMVDTNNNLDFSDEKAFYPEVIKPGRIPDQMNDARRVQYEVYQKGKVVKAYAPIVVRMMGNEFFYNIPQYAVATFKRNNRTYELLISSTFRRTSFEESDVALSSFIAGSGKIDPNDITEIGEYIELGGTRYRNKGIDIFNNWLELEPVDSDAKAYSLQIGHPFYPFSGNDFVSGKPVSFDQYTGKYVYVDFWETGCQPCIEDMPALKQVYKRVDKSRFDFVGIVNDSPERLSRFLKKHSFDWPQIRSDSLNKLIETYHVTGYPTSVLIDPDGNVIARDLRAASLQKKLNELNPAH